MYELWLSAKEKKRFCIEVKKRLLDRNLQLKDLAVDLHRSPRSVYNFMSDNERPNRFIAAEIANYLGIERKDYADGESSI